MALSPTIGNQWGVGFGQNGLGQSMSAITSPPGGPATLGGVITAAQWNGIIQTTNKCLAHEGQSLVTPSSVAVGSPIQALTSITTGGTTAFNNSGATGLALTSGTVSSTSYSSSWGTAGVNALIFTQTLTFVSADAARYFFNAGGTISLSFTQSGGSGAASTAWNTLAASCGTVKIGFLNTTQTNNTSAPLILNNANNGGYWNCITTKLTQFKQKTAVGGQYYSGALNNNINMNVFKSGTSTNGGHPVVNIVTVWNNNSLTPINGTETVSVVVNYPSTTYLTNTWGIPTFSGGVVAGTVVDDDTVLAVTEYDFGTFDVPGSAPDLDYGTFDVPGSAPDIDLGLFV